MPFPDKYTLKLPVRENVDVLDEGGSVVDSYIKDMMRGRLIKTPGIIHPLHSQDGLYTQPPYIADNIASYPQGYVIGGQEYWQYQTPTVDNPGHNGIVHNNVFGKGKLIRTPRAVVVSHRWGWFGLDHYPCWDVYSGTSPGVENDFWNVYAPRPALNGKEPIIDYQKDLWNALTEYCGPRNIFVLDGFSVFQEGEYKTTGWICPPLNMAAPIIRADHPGRWLIGAAPRHQANTYPSTEIISFGGKLPTPVEEAYAINETWVPTDITAGEVFWIMFVTDGVQAYHGWTSDFDISGGEPFVDSGCWDQDFDYFQMMQSRMRRSGGVIVHSPKCAEFWPKWTNIMIGNNYNGRSQCITEAQDHLDIATGLMAPYGWSSLIRRAVPGAPPYVDPTNEFEYSYTFDDPQITVNDIMNKVYEFYGSP